MASFPPSAHVMVNSDPEEPAPPGWFETALESWRQNLLPLLFVMFVTLGVAVAFVMPPFAVPDETTHWVLANVRADPWLLEDPKRCTTVASLYGHFEAHEIRFHPELKMPRGRFESLDAITKRCEEPMWFPYGSAFTYPGVMLARLLAWGENDSVSQLMHVFYVGRLLQGSMVVLLLVRLLQLARRAKHIMSPGALTITAFCLAPLFMHQSFGISSDPICFAWALCLANWLLNWKQRTWFDVVLFGLIASVVAGTKPVFLPLAAGVLLLGLLIHEWPQHGSLREAFRSAFHVRRWRRSMTAWALALLLVVPMPGIVSMANYEQTSRLDLREGVSPEYNKRLLRDHPVVVIGMMTREILRRLRPNEQLGPLGWLDTRLSVKTKTSFYSIFAAAALLDGLALALIARRTAKRRQRPNLRSAPRVLLGAAALLAGLLVSAYGSALAMFLYATPMGDAEMSGMQGRYLTPVWLVMVAGLFSLLAARMNDMPTASAESGVPAAVLLRPLSSSVTVWALRAALLVVGCFYAASMFLDVAKRYF
jgi:hypothetical protein